MNDREFVAALRACGAVQFGSFTLASGKTSDYYVDIKRATRPGLLREIAGRFPLPWTLLAAARFCRNSVMTSFAGNRSWNLCGRLGANSATALRTVWARASVGRPRPTRRR